MGTEAYRWRGEKEKGADGMAQCATEIDKGRCKNKKGKQNFPVALTEVL